MVKFQYLTLTALTVETNVYDVKTFFFIDRQIYLGEFFKKEQGFFRSYFFFKNHFKTISTNAPKCFAVKIILKPKIVSLFNKK